MLCANVECKFILALEQHVALGTDVCAVDEVNPVCSQPGIMMMTYMAMHMRVGNLLRRSALACFE